LLFVCLIRYDPETTISDRVEFENERVEFLTSIASLLASKARLKLNTKKLYASDGRAVQELLKLASLLYKATKTASKSTEEESIPPPIKVQDVKVTRTLASEITLSGAKLYDLLADESTERTERSKALRFLDQAGAATEGSREHAFIERSIREIIETTKQQVEDLRKECEELEADEKNLDNKIKKKQEEYERTEKRLHSLENIKPQFVDEVEKLEKELQYHYDIYIEKYRNLDYIQHELDKYHKAEEERKQEHEKRLLKMRERLYREEVELLRGSGKRSDEIDDDKRLVITQRVTSDRSNSANGRGGKSQPSNKVKAQGSLQDAGDESSEGESDDEGSDRIDSDDEELSIASRSRDRNRGQTSGQSSRRDGNTSNRRSNKRSNDEGEEFEDDDDNDEDDDGDDDDMSEDNGEGSEESDDRF